MATPTKQDIANYLEAVQAIGSTIREVDFAPLGPMFMAVERIMSLTTFQGILRRFEEAGLIELTTETATWIGPRS